jgi:hypothetical protein
MHNHRPAPESRSATGTSVDRRPDDTRQPQRSHSMWWMVACCAPMILIALAIVLGVFGSR